MRPHATEQQAGPARATRAAHTCSRAPSRPAAPLGRTQQQPRSLAARCQQRQQQPSSSGGSQPSPSGQQGSRRWPLRREQLGQLALGSACIGAVVAEPLPGGGSGGKPPGGGGGGGGGGPWGEGGGSSRNPVAEIAAGRQEPEEAEEEEEYEEEEVEYVDEEGNPVTPEGEDEVVVIEEAELPEGEASPSQGGEGDAPGGGPRGARGAGAGASRGPGRDYSKLPKGQFFVHEVVVKDLPSGPGLPKQEELFAGTTCQPGFLCTRDELAADLKRIVKMGLFQSVDSEVQPTDLGKNVMRVEFRFKDRASNLRTIKSIDIAPAMPKSTVSIPKSLVKELNAKYGGGKAQTDTKTMAALRNAVDQWYQERGLQLNYFTHFDGLDNGELKINVMEPKISKISIITQDDRGEKIQGKLSPDVILRELKHLQAGQPYRDTDGQVALANVFGLGLFENVMIDPQQNKRDVLKVEVEIILKERPLASGDLELEWQLAPDAKGRPGLAAASPAGSITWENRNLFGEGVLGSLTVNFPDILRPEGDLNFVGEYKHPYLRGDRDKRKAYLHALAFNTRRASAVFTGSSTSEGNEVPPIFVGRTGCKVGVHETYSRKSVGSLALVAEQVSATDETGAPAPQGQKMLATGQPAPSGPPTTLSPSGRDNLLFLQGTLLRDTTYSVAGATLGERQALTAEQGLGVGVPLFNRCRLDATRFFRLRESPADSPSPPVTLVVHGAAGSTVGALPSYELFQLGGPHSVRGYSLGEIAAARSFAEAALELRAPVWGTKHQVYAFAEGASDLGSSKAVKGNPTEFFRKPGQGASLGAGLKLGAVRLEYATDQTIGRGNLFVRFGERF